MPEPQIKINVKNRINKKETIRQVKQKQTNKHIDDRNEFNGQVERQEEEEIREYKK